MPLIRLQLEINAPVGRCFDLSRSIDLHMLSTAGTREKAIEGVTSGLIGAGEYVTWEATHFGVRQRLRSFIPVCNRPFHFRDEQVSGPFAVIRHDHFFEDKGAGVTLVTDEFYFRAPYGLLGRLAEKLILQRYLRRFLINRNLAIKHYAESGKWKTLTGFQP